MFYFVSIYFYNHESKPKNPNKPKVSKNPNNSPPHGMPVLGLLAIAQLACKTHFKNMHARHAFENTPPTCTSKTAPSLFFSPVPSTPLAWTPTPPACSPGPLPSVGCLKPSPCRACPFYQPSRRPGNPVISHPHLRQPKENIQRGGIKEKGKHVKEGGLSKRENQKIQRAKRGALTNLDGQQ